MLLRTSLAFVLALGAACAQEAGAAAKQLRLHVIGASVSGGFRDGPMFKAKEQGDSVTLHQVLKAWCGEHARATTHAPTQMTVMFTSPHEIGEAQIAGALKAKPDFVIGIDFPFWFAYGGFFAAEGGTAGTEADQRAANLKKGCDMLAKLEMPVLIGDLPDMRGAAPRMLSPAWIPKPDVLTKLNEQLAAFAKQHANVRILPLAQFVETMKTKGALLPLAAGPMQTAPYALLQEDKLHATRLGMAYLGFVLQDHLRALFPKDHPLHTQAWKFEQFVEACGAEGELENLRAAAKKPAEAGAGAGSGNGK